MDQRGDCFGDENTLNNNILFVDKNTIYDKHRLLSIANNSLY